MHDTDHDEPSLFAGFFTEDAELEPLDYELIHHLVHELAMLAIEDPRAANREARDFAAYLAA